MKKIILISFSFLSIFSTCKKEKFNGYDNRLHITNNSNIDIYFAPFYSYPDTTLNGKGVVPTISPTTYKVTSQSTEKLSVNCCWEGIIQDLPSDTLMLFLFDAQVLDNTPWDTVKTNYFVLRRYDLSLQNLENLDWTIIYP